ncbi:3'-5' exonuclease [Longibacter sp.]|uniref:3'-5' exonuclease n=1 Tax=Longibacter sp. TaxID=2045415 RepID=UPI003EB9B131
MPDRPLPDRPPWLDPAVWTDGQRAAITSDAGAVILRGGLRSGKTTALIARTLRHARCADAEDAVYMITNTAVGAVRLRSMVGATDAGGGIEVRTVHELATQVLRALDASEDWTLSDSDTDRSRVRRILSDLGYRDLSDRPYDVWREIRQRRARGSHPPVPSSFPLTDDEVTEVMEMYCASMDRTRTLDPPGLLRRATDAMEENKRRPVRVRHLLIDDAENLSPVEVGFLRMLEADSVTVAMNPDASVMASLGADPSAVEEWMTDWPTAHEVDLARKKSRTPILEAAERVLTDAAGRDTGKGDGKADAIQMFTAPSATAERERVAQAIREVIDREEYAPGDVAVLAPTESLRDECAATLRGNDLPVDVLASPWHGQAAILDILSYLVVLLNPNDNAHLFRVINRPSRGIGRKTKERIRAYAAENNLSAWDAIERARSDGALTSRARRVLGRFRDLVEPLIGEARRASAEETARAVLAETELLTPVTRGRTREQIEREEQIERFLQTLPDAGDIEALRAFLDRVALGYAPGQPTGIRVATIRAARDTTVPVVFVVGLEEGELPAGHAVRRESLLAEERRRLAVAISRGTSTTVLSWSQSRGSGRREEPTSRSRFWSNVGSIPTYRPQTEDAEDYRTSLRSKQASSTSSPQPTEEDANAIRPGQRVRHAKLGSGVVDHVEQDEKQHVATVTFDKRGTKTLNLKYASLTILEDGG